LAQGEADKIFVATEFFVSKFQMHAVMFDDSTLDVFRGILQTPPVPGKET
jgi:hypothetical protein